MATSGACVSRLVAKYGWDWFSGGAVTTIVDLRERLLTEWNATFTHGGEEIVKALRERHGAPREVGSRHVYDTYILTGHAGAGRRGGRGRGSIR